jgi:glycosyltransferase involved in cell wall biosynthesis
MSASPPPSISVVVPVRDAAATLGVALGSLHAQTRPDWECLVVDDGSTDDSPALAARFAAEDRRFRLLARPPRGLVAALNDGLAEARGRFIARLDADDVCAPERFALQAAWLERDSALGLVSCQVRFGGDRQLQAGFARHVDWLNSLLTPEAIARNRFMESPVAHPSVMFRRELVGRWGGYRDGPFPEDYELWLRWLEQGVRFAKAPRELLLWTDRLDRLSRRDPRYSPAAFAAVKAPYLARAIRRCLRGRALWIWGAGRETRRRLTGLLAEGLTVNGFIDVDRKKWGRHRDGRLVIGPDHLPRPDEALVLAHVGKLGARELIRERLVAAGFEEERDFWVAA